MDYTNYRKALAYARVLCPDTYKDVVHESYLNHFKKEGTDLFDKNIYSILNWVKNTWYNSLRYLKYKKDGEFQRRQFYDVDLLHLSSGFSPETILNTKTFYENLFKLVDDYQSEHGLSKTDPKLLRKILEMLDEGWTQTEIGRELGISVQNVHYYKLKLKAIINKMESTHNPFNGSKIKVKKRITRRTYNENPDKYSEYIYDADKDCDFNEFYAILCNQDGEYILVRENVA